MLASASTIAGFDNLSLEVRTTYLRARFMGLGTFTMSLIGFVESPQRTQWSNLPIGAASTSLSAGPMSNETEYNIFLLASHEYAS